MLLASHLGFLALVAPAQTFIALSFDPLTNMQSDEGTKSFMIKGNIYQCLVNTYYAASFVFCFASSSIFRREIDKLLNKHYKPKQSIVSEAYFPTENRPFLQQKRLSGLNGSSSSPHDDYLSQSRMNKRSTESTIEADGCF